jgi:hypothetical protein
MGDTPQETYIMTLDQLVQYHNTTLDSEAKDRASLISIINPSTSEIQHKLIQWASAGFPSKKQVLSVSLVHPSPCSDGKVRDMYDYIFYLTGSTIDYLTATFQSKFLGIRFSAIISANNCVNLHASKFDVDEMSTSTAPY